jgi:hypothetical protein
MPPYFDDDGTEVDPDMYPKPGLCLICKKFNDPSDEMLCNLNRLDQRNEREFKCGAYESIGKDQQ